MLAVFVAKLQLYNLYFGLFYPEFA